LLTTGFNGIERQLSATTDTTRQPAIAQHLTTRPSCCGTSYGWPLGCARGSGSPWVVPLSTRSREHQLDRTVLDVLPVSYRLQAKQNLVRSEYRSPLDTRFPGPLEALSCCHIFKPASLASARKSASPLVHLASSGFCFVAVVGHLDVNLANQSLAFASCAGEVTPRGHTNQVLREPVGGWV
jgi:hypothetical protein